MTIYSSHRTAPLRQTIFWGANFAAVLALLLYLKWVALWKWHDAAFYAYSILVTSYILARFGLAGLYKPPKVTENYTPSVSVVIPVFNEEDEIEHTVKTWLDSDYPDGKYEVIVIDDGSRDGTLEKLVKLKQEMFGKPLVADWLGKMQKLRYWSAFDRYKRSESVTGSVICLSGCFSAVRRIALDNIVDEWLHQSFMGREASYGDDRALTTLLLKYGWNTIYVPSAKAKTIVPETWRKFWRQQMRWEKSYIRETIIGSKFMWRRPLAAVEYYVGAFVTWGAFVVAAYTIWFRPIFTHGTFLPWVYLFGLAAVSLLYAINYRQYNRDRLWVYAPIWGILYAVILIWRFPLAVMEMHKSDWKTR